MRTTSASKTQKTSGLKLDPAPVNNSKPAASGKGLITVGHYSFVLFLMSENPKYLRSYNYKMILGLKFQEGEGSAQDKEERKEGVRRGKTLSMVS